MLRYQCATVVAVAAAINLRCRWAPPLRFCRRRRRLLHRCFATTIELKGPVCTQNRNATVDRSISKPACPTAHSNSTSSPPITHHCTANITCIIFSLVCFGDDVEIPVVAEDAPPHLQSTGTCRFQNHDLKPPPGERTAIAGPLIDTLKRKLRQLPFKSSSCYSGGKLSASGTTLHPVPSPCAACLPANTLAASSDSTRDNLPRDNT